MKVYGVFEYPDGTKTTKMPSDEERLKLKKRLIKAVGKIFFNATITFSDDKDDKEATA